MSISSEITRISNNVTNSFTAVGDMGGTVPASTNSDNLATAIRSIPTAVTEIFWAEYGTTTYSDINTAYTAGKQIFVKRTELGQDYIFPLVSVQSNKFIFGIIYAASAGGDPMYSVVYVNSSGTWNSFSAGTLQKKLTAGSGISISGTTISSTVSYSLTGTTLTITTT